MSEHELKTIETTEQERSRRLSFCDQCEHNQFDDPAVCIKCACPITFITQFEFKVCPEGIWQ